MPSASPSLLKIAIVGAGPGGLGAAIALSALPNVSVKLYEKARELREIGTGITVGYNGWKVLELLGADGYVKGDLKIETLQRNGVTGEIVDIVGRKDVPREYEDQRVRRANLQTALLKKIPEGTIELKKLLSSMENLSNGGVKLSFADGTETEVDLVVGADGIRSVVRQNLWPSHATTYTGTTIWRSMIPITAVAHIPGILPNASWWHGPQGHIYFTIVDPVEWDEKDRMLEITANRLSDPATAPETRYSWGVPATNERVLSHYTEYNEIAQEALRQVPEGSWMEFSAFAGPELPGITGWGKAVLIGDASHPIVGGLGSGATFALEDGWILARAIEKTRDSPNGLAEALKIFQAIRGPYYSRMFKHLADHKVKVAAAKAANPNQSFDSALKVRIPAFARGKELAWVNQNDIQIVWDNYWEAQAQEAAHPSSE